MKHKVRKLALVLALALLLSTLALAADANAEIVPVEDPSITLRFNANNLSMTLTKTGLTPGGMYLVLVLKGTDTVPTESNILYINQATADEKGTVTFDNVYPSSLVDSTGYLSGTGLAGLTKMGFIDLQVMLGDVNGDNIIDVGDAIVLLRYIAGLESEIGAEALAAADVNGDNIIDVGDAMELLRNIAGLSDKSF